MAGSSKRQYRANGEVVFSSGIGKKPVSADFFTDCGSGL